MGMTLPIVTVIRTDENHSVVSNDVTVAYYLPTEHQAQPPQPSDSDIVIENWPSTIVYTRSVENKINMTSFYYSNLTTCPLVLRDIINL